MGLKGNGGFAEEILFGIIKFHLEFCMNQIKIFGGGGAIWIFVGCNDGDGIEVNGDAVLIFCRLFGCGTSGSKQN